MGLKGRRRLLAGLERAGLRVMVVERIASSGCNRARGQRERPILAARGRQPTVMAGLLDRRFQSAAARRHRRRHREGTAGEEEMTPYFAERLIRELGRSRFCGVRPPGKFRDSHLAAREMQEEGRAAGRWLKNSTIPAFVSSGPPAPAANDATLGFDSLSHLGRDEPGRLATWIVLGSLCRGSDCSRHFPDYFL